MRTIKMLSEDMRCNIDEAKDKIMTAYSLKDESPTMASWYKDMAQAHIGFNTPAHALITKLIGEYKASDEYKEHPEYADGMMAVWNAVHADMVAKTAEVSAMITSFK